jgi:cytochrome c peroxidase
VKKLLVLAILAGCPHKQREKVEPPPEQGPEAPLPPLASGDASGSAAGSAAVTLPPSPPLPGVPVDLPMPPPNDAITPDAVAYGAALFTDPAVSRSGKTACASCHDPQHGYSGGMDTSDGGERQPLRTPALVNLAWARSFGWDGKVTALPDFLASHVARELGTERVPATPLYAAYDAKLGGERPWLAALQAFVLTRYAGDSRWDRLERTRERPKDLDTGYKLFAGKAGCAHCHAPPLYTDGQVHDGFLTPTVRDVAPRPALLHDGSATLANLLDHHGDARLSPDEKSLVVAYLKAL